MIIAKKKLKTSKFALLAITALMILVVFSFFTIDRKNLNFWLQNVNEKLMAFDPGFSSPRNLIDTGEDIIRASDNSLKIKSIFINIPKIIFHKFNDNSNDLNHIDITIKFKNLQKILKERKLAIKNGFLNNSSYVNATIKFDQKKYEAEIRLKGNISDHWLSKKRMSLRVRLKNGESILGYNTFSIQKPRARQYPYEQAFQESLISSGNLAAKYNFGNVRFNGENWGVMIIEEEVSKEFLEKQGKKDSIVFKFSDDRKRLKNTSSYHSDYRMSDERLFATLVREKKYLSDIDNRKFYTYILEKRLEKKHPEIYSESHHIRSFIASLFWNNQHTLFNSNSKYYFNPYTLELEPITADQLNFSLYTDQLDEVLEDISLSEVYKQVFSLPMEDSKINRYLASSIELFSDIEKNLNQNHNYFPLDAYKKDVVLKSNINLINKNKNLLYQWLDNVNLKQKALSEQREKTFDSQDGIFPQHLHVRHYDDGQIMLFNLLPQPLKINTISFSGNFIRNRNFIIPGYKKGNYEPYVINTNISGIQDNQILVESTYKNNVRKTVAYPTLVSDGIINPLMNSNFKEFDFIKQLDSNSYEIESGDWVINKPIVISGSLNILPGANLKFSKDAYLIVKGSLTAEGNIESRITFKALADSWKGIYVLNSKDKSSLNHVTISNISALEDNLLNLSGGLTFYQSDIDLRDVKLIDIKAEDAINIVESKFSINSLHIENAYSDGLDSDFSSGTIINSFFNDIGGDAVDFSGSEVLIDNAIIEGVKDKAISAGEASSIKIRDSFFDNVAIGIVSKDGSNVEVLNTKITNYYLHAIMSFYKKGFYSMPSIEIRSCQIDPGNAFVRQSGTNMIIDGAEEPEIYLNVDLLYK
jgi:hypothetical protein